MDDIIHLLPDSVANQIAAGEVVQRPSSIIKEMVENSLDAGAEHIQVLVVDGGKTNVQIIDDGKGMSETDARLAFERHATSKINTASDLFNLSTMGFRGEALASIAAVAQIELKTRRPGDELGTCLEVEGSVITSQEPVLCPVGANFSVKNLFFNVPARRKFLKSNQTELTNVVTDFQRIVLAHPEVSFALYNNGAEMYNLPQASLRQRIVDVYGKKVNVELLPVEVETSLVTISGYVGKPESSKKKGSHQFFFVNGRFMRHPYFHSAVMRAFENVIPAGEHVSYFLYFSVDPSTIDVNVHPTKTEIKFDNEQPIWQVLSAAVKESIGKHCSVPLIDFDVEDRPEIPVIGSMSDMPVQPRLSAPTYNPFKSPGSQMSRGNKQRNAFDDFEKLYAKSDNIELSNSALSASAAFGDLKDDFGFGEEREGAEVDDGIEVASGDGTQFALWNEDAEAQINEVVGSNIVGVPKFQFRGQYIVMPVKKGLMLVDQYRAHVRVLYEQNMQCMMGTSRSSQKELFPIIVAFDKREQTVLETLLNDITALGFELNNLGGGSYSVEGVPADIEVANADKMLHEMVHSAMDMPINAVKEMKESIALAMAKQSAIVKGQVLSLAEMDGLLQNLFALTECARTPDGKLVYSVLDDKKLLSEF